MILDSVLENLVSIFRSYPQIPIFLSLAIGYYVGKIKYFGFSLGSTASVLLTAIVLGQMNIEVTTLIKSVAFALFIFTIGYKVGPHFFGGLKKDGVSYILLSLFFAIVALITAILLGKLFGFDQGTTAGLLGGSITQSSIIGTAEGAIKNLSISHAQKNILTSNVAVAYAITYIFGVAGLILFYKIAPRLLKLNLKDEAKKLEIELSGEAATEADADVFEWNTRPHIRTYRVTNTELEGKKAGKLQGLTIEKIKRGETLIDPTPDTIIHTNDIILIIGNRKNVIKAHEIIGPEIEDPTLAKLTDKMLKVCITKPTAIGKKLGEIMRHYCKNCFVAKVTRSGHELPIKKNTTILNCDILHIVGLEKNVEYFAQQVGYAKRKTKATDLAMVGLGCFIGTLLGLLSIKIGAIPLTLGIGGGVLLAGLFFGWLQSLHPTFGQIPNSAQWILTELGLNLFIACVGLTAGPRAIHALQTHGIKLFFAGVILTLVPHILSILFGKKILKLNTILLLGALTGAGTATPSLNVLKDEADSSTPALGYSIPYAIGNFVLTIWGTIVVNFM